jgi:hypothetical protein
MLYPDDWRDDDPSRGLDLDEWLDVGATSQTKRLESFERANSSFNWIASRCQTGELESGIRPVPGGEIVPLPASSWATEHHRLKDRLVFCQMRIDDPFAYGVGGFGPENEKGMGYVWSWSPTPF